MNTSICSYSKPSSTSRRIEPQRGCYSCSASEFCVSKGLDDSRMLQFDRIVARRRKVAKGEPLFRVNDPMQSIYVVRLGHVKTHKLLSDGDARTIGFYMAGDLIGWDAIARKRHTCDATALEDTEVCVIPFSKFESMLGAAPMLMRRFHSLMSEEIMHEQEMILMLGGMRIEQRMAIFLVELAERYAARGYSATSFHLRMCRADIGAYLGVTLETISRLLTRFGKLGLVKVDSRKVELVDLPQLMAIAGRGGSFSSPVWSTTACATPVQPRKCA